MSRMWATLVAFTAVFLLHGLQCAGHDSPPRADGAPPALTPADSGSHHLHPAAGALASPVAPDLLGSGSARTQQPRPSSDDLETVCLTVLSAGLAFLVLLLRRPGPRCERHRPWARVQRWISAPALLRPPDPFTLCVLRN